MDPKAPTKVSLIKGDGIGPEICESVVTVLDALKTGVVWDEVEAGLGAIHKTGKAITDDDLDRLARNKIAIKGPTTTPVGGGHKSVNVTIRKALDLYVNVRPCISLPGLETPFKDVNLVIVRENIEDTYSGIEHMQSPDVAQTLRVITRPGSARAHRYAFELARREARKKVSCVHKANIMKLTCGLFLESFRQVAAEFSDIAVEDIIVDNCCMQLVTKPHQFDVMVLTNLFGDIVSDLCAGLVGGLGVAAGANIGKDCAVFEAVHGSAPDIAGRGVANPTAILLSSAQMLKHMGQVDAGVRIETAIRKTLLNVAHRTRDLGGTLGTKDYTRAVVDNL